MPTNLFTEVKIGEASYSVKKFDAKTGLKIARLVISKAAPLIPLLDTASRKSGDKNDGNKVYAAVGAVLETLSDDDMDNLVDKCLRVCSLNLPAGPAPVIDETGHYGVEDVEYDMALTIRLCVEAIKWGASDFFGGKNSALSQILGQAGSLLSR